MHEVVLDDCQLHDVLGKRVDVGVDAAGLRVTAKEMKREWATLELIAKKTRLTLTQKFYRHQLFFRYDHLGTVTVDCFVGR